MLFESNGQVIDFPQYTHCSLFDNGIFKYGGITYQIRDDQVVEISRRNYTNLIVINNDSAIGIKIDTEFTYYNLITGEESVHIIPDHIKSSIYSFMPSKWIMIDHKYITDDFCYFSNIMELFGNGMKEVIIFDKYIVIGYTNTVIVYDVYTLKIITQISSINIRNNNIKIYDNVICASFKGYLAYGKLSEQFTWDEKVYELPEQFKFFYNYQSRCISIYQDKTLIKIVPVINTDLTKLPQVIV
jgi:hypothetical protein